MKVGYKVIEGKVRVNRKTGELFDNAWRFKMSENNKPRLRQRYDDEVIAKLLSEFNYANVMQVPRLQKVVINL